MIKFILLLTNLYFLYSQSYNYDSFLVKSAVNISQATYCYENLNNWNCSTCDSTNIFETASLINGELVVYGYNKVLDSLFIGFRGSTNIDNWLTNIHFSMIHPFNNEIGIEKGFYNLFLDINNDIYKNLDTLSNYYDSTNLLITGHSLGGAISTLLAYDIVSKNKPYKITLITFGSPRVGNINFIKDFNKYNIYSHRITHYYDIVPHLPQQALGYYHISQEIWFNKDNSIYQLCNDLEDDNCSNSCAPTKCTSIDDHLNYLNISIGTDGEC